MQWGKINYILTKVSDNDTNLTDYVEGKTHFVCLHYGVITNCIFCLENITVIGNYISMMYCWQIYEHHMLQKIEYNLKATFALWPNQIKKMQTCFGNPK